MAGPRTEFSFLLPKGWVDPSDVPQRRGRMRLATARDELEALADVGGLDDPRLAFVVLSRVIVQLGEHDAVTPSDLEGLFAVDMAYLQDVYSAINYGTEDDIVRVVGVQVDVASLTAPDVIPPPEVVTTSQAVSASPTVAEPSVDDAAPATVRDALSVVPAADGASEEAEEEAAPALVARAQPSGRRSRIEELGRVSRPTSGGR